MTICVTAVNGASSSTYSPASAPNDVMSSITLCIGFFCPTTSTEAITAIAAKMKNAKTSIVLSLPRT